MARTKHLDEIDMRILKILARNSRTSIREIARELGLAVSTVHARLQRLVSTGIIKKFTIIPDYESLGYTISALILLQVEGEKIIDAEKVLATEPNVMAVYDITGDYDVAVIARFRDVSDLDAFVKRINRIPFVKRTVTSIILRVTKEDIASPLLSDN